MNNINELIKSFRTLEKLVDLNEELSKNSKCRKLHIIVSITSLSPETWRAIKYIHIIIMNDITLLYTNNEVEKENSDEIFNKVEKIIKEYYV